MIDIESLKQEIPSLWNQSGETPGSNLAPLQRRS